MKKYIFIILLISLAFKSNSHENHYKDIKKIEMDVIRNGEIVGYSNYFFNHADDKMIVKNNTNFKVDLFGIEIFSILSESTEIYEGNKLISFKSNTMQNEKNKYVNLIFDKLSNSFVIDGSSYKGKASSDSIVGNWWNHDVLEKDKQISPLSGSIKEQNVILLGTEEIIINEKKYFTEHYKLKSKNENLPKDKRLDFDIWLNPRNKLILKVSYKRMGNWEYKIKNLK